MRVITLVTNYNERGKVGAVLAKFTPNLCDEVVIVDDGSTDGSLEEVRAAIVKSPVKMTLIAHGVNRGVGCVVRTAIEYGRAQGYDIIAMLAGNGKDNPQELPKLIRAITEGGYDYIQGSRFLEGGAYDNLPFARKFMIKGFGLIMKVGTGYRGTDATNGFRAYRLSLFDDPRINISQKWLDRYEMEIYIHYLVIRLGYKITEVPVSKIYPKQLRGQKVKYSKIRPFVDWWKIMRPVIFLRLGIKK